MAEGSVVRTEKYGEVHFYNEFKPKKEKLQWEWTVFVRAPVHLYDIVDFTPAGMAYLHHSDGHCEERWCPERQGESVWTSPRGTRIDHETDTPMTADDVVPFLDWFYKDAIENDEGYIGHAKIIGEK